MDPIVDDSAFLMVFLFVFSIVKVRRDPHCESWDAAFDCNLRSLGSGLELHRVGMQVHPGQLQDVLPSLEDDDHSWKIMEFAS
jgi:hypothetical protein